MATFGELKTAAALRLLDKNGTAVSPDSVGRAINDAIALWKKKEFWFNQKEAIVPVSVGDETIQNFPSDFLRPLDTGAFSYAYANWYDRLPTFNAGDYDYAYMDTPGAPVGVGFISGSWRVYPKADRDYTIKVRYIKDYPDLITDDDVNDFTLDANRLVLMQALSNLTGELQQDEKMSPYYEGEAQKEYAALKLLTHKIMGTNRLTVWDAPAYLRKDYRRGY